MLAKKILLYLESQKLPTYQEDYRSVVSYDGGAMNSKVYALPGGHSKVRFKILIQCTRYCDRELLTISCVSKHIKIAPGLREDAFEHFNAENAKSLRSWSVYYGDVGSHEPTEFRLSAALFDCSWHSKSFMEEVHKVIVQMNNQFSKSLASLLEFLESKDPEHRSRHASFTRQFNVLSVHFPKDSLRHNFIYDITEKAASHLNKEKNESLCTLYANGVVEFKKAEEGVVLVGAVECDLGFIEVRLRFFEKNDEVVFQDDPDKPLEEMSRVHQCLRTELGVFHLVNCDSSKKESKVLKYTLKALHCGLEKRDRQQMVINTIDSALEVAQSGYKNLFTYVSQSLDSIATVSADASMRPKRAKEMGKAELTHLDWAQAIKDRMPVRVWDRQLISYTIRGGKAIPNADDLQKITFENKPDDKKIKEFFLSLVDEGVYFHRLPLEALYKLQDKVVLVPDFDPSDLCKQVSPSKYLNLIESSLEEAHQRLEPGYQPPLSSSSLYCIDPANLSISVLDDPSLEIYPGSKLYCNTLNSVAVILRKLPEKKVASIGRLMSLQHQNLARVFGYTDKMKYMVREKGETTFEQLPIDQIPLPSLLDILKQVAEGMEYLHSRGEYHFRLKPANIVFKAGDIPLVADYGIHSRSENFDLSKDQFTDPNIVARKKTTDEEKKMADVWSFGMLMHYVLVGKLLFERYCKRGEVWDREKFLLEVAYKLRRPIIPASFERKHPRLVLLIRNCFFPETNKRPTFSAIVKILSNLDR